MIFQNRAGIFFIMLMCMLSIPAMTIGSDSRTADVNTGQCSLTKDGHVAQLQTTENSVEAAKIIPILYLLNLTGGSQDSVKVTVTASSFENVGGNYHPPHHAYDSNYSTRWSAFGVGEWIQFHFSKEVILGNVSIAFHHGNQRSSSFIVQVSDNGNNWTEVFNGESSGTSTALEHFSFSEVQLFYLRIVGNGNSLNDWNSFVEVVFQDLVTPTCSDGVRNQDETGVDCGGVCGGNCCSNEYQDSNLGETGIDCGGSCPACYLGVTYYVSSSSGNDDNDGLTPSTAWRSIDEVNETLLQGGDAVLFKRGDTWRDELVITSSGRTDAHIIFAAYGTGEKPRILGSEQAGNWVIENDHPNVWRSATSLSIPDVGHPASIFFGGFDGSVTWGKVEGYSSVPTCTSDFSTLNQEYDWCWDNAIYVYSPQTPAAQYAFVEVPQRRGSITMVSHAPQEYITIDGLELMFGTMYGYNDGWPMNYEVRGLNIRNCHIGYIGIRGGASAMGLVIWHSDMLVQNNDIHDCGRRSISYNIYTDNSSQPNGMVFENVIFENNTLHNGYHTTGFDVSHGDGRENTLKNFTFRNNLIYDVNTDNPNDRVDDYTSMGLYLWTGAADFEDFKIYNNVLKNIKQKGFAIGSGTGGGFLNLGIYNNVLYGMNPNISNYRALAHIGGTHHNLRFNNNIMYGTINPNNYVSRCLYLSSSQSGVASLDYNLYYQDYPTQQIINNYSGSYRMSDWADYLSDTGWDQHSPAPQNPLFTNPDNNNFHLLPGSAGLNAGVDVGLPYAGVAPHIGIDDTIGTVGADMSN